MVYLGMEKKSEKSKFEEKISIIRGHVLQRLIELEASLEFYIAETFALDDKMYELLLGTVISPRMEFMGKLEAFQVIADMKNPEFKTKNPKYAEQIKTLIEHRNVFAHLLLDNSDEAISFFNETSQFRFIKFKNRKIKEKGQPKEKWFMSLTNHIVYHINDIQILHDDAERFLLEIRALPPH